MCTDLMLDLNTVGCDAYGDGPRLFGSLCVKHAGSTCKQVRCGVLWSGVESNAKCSVVECSGVRWRGVECGAVKCCAVWWNAVEWGGVECSRVLWSAVECSVGQCTCPDFFRMYSFLLVFLYRSKRACVRHVVLKLQ